MNLGINMLWEGLEEWEVVSKRRMRTHKMTLHQVMTCRLTLIWTVKGIQIIKKAPRRREAQDARDLLVLTAMRLLPSDYQLLTFQCWPQWNCLPVIIERLHDYPGIGFQWSIGQQGFKLHMYIRSYWCFVGSCRIQVGFGLNSLSSGVFQIRDD